MISISEIRNFGMIDKRLRLILTKILASTIKPISENNLCDFQGTKNLNMIWQYVDVWSFT